MRLFGPGLIGFVVVAGVAGPDSPGPGKEGAPAGVEKEVRAALQDFRDATAKADKAALDRLLADGFTGLQPVGTSYDRAGWIELVAKGGFAFQRADDAERLDDTLTVHGAVAAAHTVLNRYRVAARKRDLCLQTRTILAKLDGRWRVISVQGSLIHDGPLVEVNYDGVVGKYDIEGGGTYTVTKVGRTLFGQRSGLPQKSPIFEAAGGGFEGPLGRWKLTFHRDDQERMTRLTFSSDGKDLWRAKKAD